MSIDELKYEIVTSDLYFIASRLKELDSSYFIVRDRKSGVYQVHNSSQRGFSYALTLPYKELDCRTLKYVRRTRSERRDELIKELNRDNVLLQKKERDRLVKRTESGAERLLREGL